MLAAIGRASGCQAMLQERAAPFGTTAARRADEVPQETMSAMFDQQQKLLKLLQEKPEILDNIKQFVALLKDNGASASLPARCVSCRF